MGDPSGREFESWRPCEHCGGTGKRPRDPASPPDPAAASPAEEACSWCRDGRYPASGPESTTLTPEELAAMLWPVRRGA